MEEEEDPLATPFVKCETPEKFPHCGDTEENIFICELPYNFDTDLNSKARSSVVSEPLDKDYTDIEDYSTDTASEISNTEEVMTNESQKKCTDETNSYGDPLQTCDKQMLKNSKPKRQKQTIAPHFVCNVCSKIIKGKFALKSHMIIHSGERPFSCEICGKTFARKRIFQEHELVHSGVRPFTCDICQKSFAKRGTLTKHKVTHTGDRKHKCDICNKTFAQRSALMKHRYSHTGERPHSCNFCEKAFTVRCALRRHIDKFHPDENKTQNT